MSKETNKICPRCDSAKVKDWDELDRDELIAAERFTQHIDEPRRLSVCIKCWFIIEPKADANV